MQRFKGKNVLITGAGSGFGRRTAELFAGEGAKNIYLVDRLQDRLDASAIAIRELGANPVTICADLGDMKQCADVIAQALSVDKKLDVPVQKTGNLSSAISILSRTSPSVTTPIDPRAIAATLNNSPQTPESCSPASITITSPGWMTLNKSNSP